MALIPAVLAVTKIQAFLASILLLSFPYCSVLSLRAHPPTAFLPPFSLCLLEPLFLFTWCSLPLLALTETWQFPKDTTSLAEAAYSPTSSSFPILCFGAEREK